MKFLVFLGLLFAIFSCEKAEKEVEQPLSENTAKNVVNKTTSTVLPTEQGADTQSISFQTIEWTDLIPKENLDILMNPPEYINDIEDGSSADQVVSDISNIKQTSNTEEDRYQQALVSTDIIEAMDGKNIRIPGFIVPIDFNERQKITSFFLVPYFGACLHMPPPPPNQVIYVQIESGFVLNSLYEPVWVSGKLSTELFEDPLATSAYFIEMHKIEPYEDGDS